MTDFLLCKDSAAMLRPMAVSPASALTEPPKRTGAHVGARRNRPPLNALRAFEASARLLSFTLAGEELGVTQVAVSRHVRTLEEYLGTVLFKRGPRSLRLTSEGARLLPSISRALDEISLAVSQVSRRGRRDVLAIQAYTTFAQHWLIPLLSNFHDRHPGIEVRLSASLQPVDFDRQDVDAAVRSGTGHWPGLEADLLTPIELVPVMNPALLKGAEALRRPEDLAGTTLLHSLARPDDWDAWLRGAVSAGAVDSRKGLKFESSAMAYEAASQGLGVAIGVKVLVERYLASGVLVAPFARTLTLPEGYYLVRPRDRPASAALKAFRSWLIEELSQVRQASSDRPSRASA